MKYLLLLTATLGLAACAGSDTTSAVNEAASKVTAADEGLIIVM